MLRMQPIQDATQAETYYSKSDGGYYMEEGDLRRPEFGDERDPKVREFLNRIAPANNATKITKPLFVVQGANDPRVPASESVQMVETVRKNCTPVWYLLAKDEGHNFVKKNNEDFLLCCEVLFIKEYLLSGE